MSFYAAEPCQVCGQTVRQPGLSRSAWRGIYCSLTCVFSDAGEQAKAHAQKQREIQRHVDIERHKITARLTRAYHEDVRRLKEQSP